MGKNMDDVQLQNNNVSEKVELCERTELLKSSHINVKEEENASVVTVSEEYSEDGKEYPRLACSNSQILGILCLFGITFIGIMIIQVSRESNEDREHDMAALSQYFSSHYTHQSDGWNSCGQKSSSLVCQQFYLLHNQDTLNVDFEGVCIISWHKGVSAKVIRRVQSDDKLSNAHDKEEEKGTTIDNEPSIAINVRHNDTTVYLGDPIECKECELRWQTDDINEMQEEDMQTSLILALRFPQSSYYSLISVLCF